jgi:hypothetical protein
MNPIPEPRRDREPLQPARRLILLAIIGGLQLAGCASISESECQLSDWRAVGYEDGSQGRPTDTFGRYRKSCAEHGVAPDFQAYQSGREAGLREYCQQTRGFQEGARGATYQGVCPADVEPDFLAGYNDGRTLHDLEYSLHHTNRRISDNEARINQIELDLAGNMLAATADGATREERARLVLETKQLAEERAALRLEIKDLQVRRANLERDLADARKELLSRR